MYIMCIKIKSQKQDVLNQISNKKTFLFPTNI